jgi:phosphoglycerol transferase MdoB-like AlkP superfamily enzyme
MWWVILPDSQPSHRHAARALLADLRISGAGLSSVHKAVTWLRNGPFHLPATVFAGVFLFGALSRVILLAIAWADVDRSIGALVSVFLRGIVFDAVAACYAAGFISLFSVLLGNRLGGARFYRWVRFAQYTILAFILIFILASEVIFWNEFGVRFNFIAVDYLVYTTEVIGNLFESYPMVPWLMGVAATAILLAWFTGKRWLPTTYQPMRLRSRFAVAAGIVLGCVALFFSFDGGLKERSANAYNNELAANGSYLFVQAYRNNEIDFSRFYRLLPEAELQPRLQAQLDAASATPVATTGAAPIRAAQVLGTEPEQRLNVVLIMVESLSAEFLGVFGSDKNLTPNIDRLSKEGLLFTNMYAIGTRTVRGLESLSAALPPLPGQSVVRRPNNSNLYTLGSVLRDHGYTTKFIYGGFGYFDNMNAYFAGNGYDVIDRSSMPSEKVGFANVWGVADEYLLDRAMEELDAGDAAGKPIFAHVMTTSNHRPFTFPAGRIDIPSKTGRDGAVKYTDYAIGRFIEQARKKPWFDKTIFIIMADHCASSAGRERLSIPKYRIPALILSPKHVAPSRFERLASQIDLAPTLLGMLHLNYASLFLGQDLLRPGRTVERAFISNYQELGYLRIGADSVKRLVVLSPKQKVSVYRVAADGESLQPETGQEALVQESQTYYQGADFLFHSPLYRAGQRALSAGGVRAASR